MQFKFSAIPTRWKIVSDGNTRVQVRYRNLPVDFQVGGFVPTPPSEGTFAVTADSEAGVRLSWPVHPRSTLQASDTIDPAQWARSAGEVVRRFEQHHVSGSVQQVVLPRKHADSASCRVPRFCRVEAKATA